MGLLSISNWILRFSTILFFAGNVLLLILIIISGGSNSYPISRFYWVEGDTSGIPHAPNVTRWTYWGACSRSDGHTHCGGTLGPAYPISPVDNFGTKTNVPSKFISRRSSLYYLTRLSFSFFWIALSFISTSFLIYAGSWFSHGVSYVTWVLTFVGCIFNILAVIFQTAASVMARDAFTDAHRHGKLGAPLFGMAWASVFLCLIEIASVVVTHFLGRRPDGTIPQDQENYDYERAQLPNVKGPSRRTTHPFRSFFSRPQNDSGNEYHEDVNDEEKLRHPDTSSVEQPEVHSNVANGEHAHGDDLNFSNVKRHQDADSLQSV
ncbi:hypothetical protein ZYGR_0Z01880 [Zygosaccharomyces rouxii]|uniref:Protein SUR7 n=1 Tax=Zygosaccharomyces rouxii TaxID=4956 RepID=A0A1Q3A4W8_ZYGRO|nr:hypothetical protein ZYGR_0Z01880 [Zygosaccharomyces rouxii]